MALMGYKRRNATVRVSKGHSAKLIELGVREFDQLEDSSEIFKSHIYDKGRGEGNNSSKKRAGKESRNECAAHKDPA